MSVEAFHAGEQAMQARAGVRERMAQVGAQVMRDFMPEQHRDFFRRLPFIVLGSVDDQGQPWASLLAARPGFVQSPDPRHLSILALPAAGTHLAEALTPGASLGLLGIEPHTRRRNRANGVVASMGDSGFAVEIRQSFGNCPKYIQARQATFVDNLAEVTIRHGSSLSGENIDLIARADTFFIATAHPDARAGADRAHGIDVSHRGGKPGFVRVDGGHTLTIPDYSGNLFFNTLGNLALNPRAGLLFPDFDRGHLLQVAATAEAIWDGEELASHAGAQRLLRFRVAATTNSENSMPLRWSEASLSPYLAATGTW